MDAQEAVLQALKVPVLKRLCKQQNVPQGGTKKDIIDRLVGMSCQELGTLINDCASDAMDEKLTPLMRRLAEQAVNQAHIESDVVVGSLETEVIGSAGGTIESETSPIQEQMSAETLPLIVGTAEVSGHKATGANEEVGSVCLVFQDPPRDAKRVGTYILTALDLETKRTVFDLQIGPATRCAFDSSQKHGCRVIERKTGFDFSIRFRGADELASFERDLQVRLRVMALAQKVSNLRTQEKPKDAEEPLLNYVLTAGLVVGVPFVAWFVFTLI